MKYSVFIFVFLFAFPLRGATTYHISVDSTYKTIGDVNGLSLVAGDSVLFKRGESFVGQINITWQGTAGNQITFGAFGTGTPPNIFAGETLTWIARGSFYAAKPSMPVKHVTVNGLNYQKARWPNTGWVYVTSGGGSSSTFIVSAGITQESDYWNGASFWHKYHAYTGTTGIISTQSTTTLNFVGTVGTTNNAGFYLSNKLSEVDTIGEWYYDAGKDSVFVYTSSDPNGLNVRASLYDYAFRDSAKSFITVRDFAFSGQALSAVWLRGYQDDSINVFKILHNTFTGQACNAIEFQATTRRCVIDSNVIDGAEKNGIEVGLPALSYSYQWGRSGGWDTISHNTIKNIGLRYLWTDAIATGINFENNCKYMYVHNNRIDSVGYNGMTVSGQYNHVDYNYITNVMLRYGDGGAIYAYSDAVRPSMASHSLIEWNIVDNSYGSADGSADAVYEHMGQGIYLDHANEDQRVQFNTVMNVGGSGQFLQYNGYRDTMYYNTYYYPTLGGKNQTAGWFHVWLDTALVFGPLGHSFVGNITYAQSETNNEPALYMQSRMTNADHQAMKSSFYLDSNYYWATQSGQDVVIRLADNDLNGSYEATAYTLAQWKSYWDCDVHSLSGYSSADTIFINPTMSAVNIDLGTHEYQTLTGTAVIDSFTLQPFASRVLLYTGETPPTASPVITSPIYSVTTRVSGTSSEADGTVILVYVNNVAEATPAYVTSGAWTYTVASVLATGDQVKAIATASGKTISEYSTVVTVIDYKKRLLRRKLD